MKVHDVMTPNPITIEPGAPIGTAIAVMAEQKVRHLPVVDEAGQLVGIITDRDVRSAMMAPALVEYLSPATRRRLVEIGARLEDLRVKDAMTWHPVTTGPDVSLTQAAALMFERRVGSLPVVDGGTVIGIVTERDVVEALATTVPALEGVDRALLW
jgi:acetoin utilization protein AcuB